MTVPNTCCRKSMCKNIISGHLSRSGEADAAELETDVRETEACWHLHTIVECSPTVSNPRGAITFATHYMLTARTRGREGERGIGFCRRAPYP
jgi:hypothetical protein